ncbi:preprotein translocase subunit SecE [Candidatus Woesebacteria bacterium RIFOXYD1_FULL_40_21]|uniref:Protein translocase subunit SecE n=1 Tax=Candidatus Woesebacteria bacterium RIFOXYD1_FULL_40_21 TaxID=1802549 RepID=A0A1F8DEZ9_9BACT|nr:MAG: preprotein translocase subunit SecE [Candidatus Woesebacteria bacterium RIFOXYD1_FULL_40_21]
MIKFHFVGNIISYLKDVRVEVGKVVWPKREEVIRLTLVVFAISIIVGAYVGGLDFVFTKLLEVLVTR